MKNWQVLNANAITNNVKKVINSGNIDNLSKASYNFISGISGFIAHYNIDGFKDYYNDVDTFIMDLKNSTDLTDYNRYINDAFFQKDEHSKDYYTSKSKTLEALNNLLNN